MAADPRRDSKRDPWLAAVLLLAALAVAYLLFVHWWFTAPLLEARAELIELRDQEQRYRLSAQQREAIEARMNEVRSFEATNAGFLPEANYELASANLMQRLQTLVNERNAQAACQLISQSPFQDERKETYKRVTIKVTLRCEMEHFVAILHGLESGSPQVFVTNFSGYGRRVFVPQGAGVPPNAGYLEIRFDLYGYLREKGKAR